MKGHHCMKCKNMMYTQDLDHLPFSSLKELIESLGTLEPQKFAGILHDKDTNEDGTLKAPHIHLVLQFQNARSISSVAKRLGDQPQYLEKWDGSVNNAYSYLCHFTSNSAHKHRYDFSEVMANFDYAKLIESISTEVSSSYNMRDSVLINHLLDLLLYGQMTKEEVEDRLTGSQLAKAKSKIDIVYKKRLEQQASMWREKMKQSNSPIRVFWFFGTAGTGKSFLAKKYAESLGSSIYHSGSSRDPFQRYNLEETIILDDLRPDTFKYCDLLRMLDPFAEDAMGASRYYDKPLTADTFIITTPYSPDDFYKEVKDFGGLNKKIDTFEQLARRLTLVQEMTTSAILLYTYAPKLKMFVSDASAEKPNSYSATEVSYSTKEDEAKNMFEVLTSLPDPNAVTKD